MNESESKYKTVQEAAAYLRRSRVFIWQERQKGRLAYIRSGRTILFRTEDLDEYMKRQLVNVEAASLMRFEATRRFGVGSGSVRTIAGTMEIHMELERRLAEFKNTEAVVVFQSGFAANAGTVPVPTNVTSIHTFAFFTCTP